MAFHLSIQKFVYYTLFPAIGDYYTVILLLFFFIILTKKYIYYVYYVVIINKTTFTDEVISPHVLGFGFIILSTGVGDYYDLIKSNVYSCKRNLN